MLYSIIEIESPGLKEALSHTCDEQPFIAKAPWLVLFAADYQRLYDAWRQSGLEPKRKPGAGDLFLACSDALIAAQTAVIAAEALGLGSCYIGDIIENAEKQRELLSLPDYVFPAAMICFGYPPEGDDRKTSQRLPLQAVVHKDRYAPKAWLDSEHANYVMRRGLTKFEAEFSAEMTRSMEVWLEKWRRI
jgi:nitroreductase